jgi:winged helix-turn helix protein
MNRTKLLQEIRKMRFEEAYQGWAQNRFTQEEAARLLGVSDRTFRRYLLKYKDHGIEGLIDKRIEQISHKRAPVDEVIALTTLYKNRYSGWNVKHFFSFYKNHHEGTRGYTWIKNTLQKEGLVSKSSKKGAHRKKRERAAMEGMMLHQDGSDHEWVPDTRWDLIVTMDDATSTHYSMFFVEEEGTVSSFQGIKDVIENHGLFCSIYTDRGHHYWHTPEAGGAVDKHQLTQFGRAMHQLGIEMIPAYSPEARGRSERAFRTHQERLPKELAMHGITTMAEANEYLKKIYMPSCNAEFAVPAVSEGSAFVPWINGAIDDILCEQYERTVRKDNCVSFGGLTLQIPKDDYRCHYNKVKVRVHRYVNGQLAIFHGPRKLAEYDNKGQLKGLKNKEAA